MDSRVVTCFHFTSGCFHLSVLVCTHLTSIPLYWYGIKIPHSWSHTWPITVLSLGRLLTLVSHWLTNLPGPGPGSEVLVSGVQLSTLLLSTWQTVYRIFSASNYHSPPSGAVLKTKRWFGETFYQQNPQDLSPLKRCTFLLNCVQSRPGIYQNKGELLVKSRASYWGYELKYSLFRYFCLEKN